MFLEEIHKWLNKTWIINLSRCAMCNNKLE